jgi:hypothetical protein
LFKNHAEHTGDYLLSCIITVVAPQAYQYLGIAYLSVVGCVVLIGLDYADSGKIINRVPKIEEIIHTVLVALLFCLIPNIDSTKKVFQRHKQFLISPSNYNYI